MGDDMIDLRQIPDFNRIPGFVQMLVVGGWWLAIAAHARPDLADGSTAPGRVAGCNNLPEI